MAGGQTRILLLGGNRFAFLLAEQLLRQHVITADQLIYSVYGITDQPNLPACRIHQGGFGGVQGLTSWIRHHEISHLIDATHRHAALITANAQTAAHQCGIPACYLRPALWNLPKQLAHSAIIIADPREAFHQAACQGTRILLTHGRANINLVNHYPKTQFFVRTASPIAETASNLVKITQKGPFRDGEEQALFTSIRPDAILAKFGDGPLPAKLILADKYKLKTILIAPPAGPQPQTKSLTALAAWIKQPTSRHHAHGHAMIGSTTIKTTTTGGIGVIGDDRILGG
ncbi:MAG: precorrin-6A/cobalt-precorrin-6A reductase [Pseudomonadota bacterium]